MSEHDAETLADALALGLWDAGIVRPEETGRAAVDYVLAELRKDGWSPPGAARAGDEPTGRSDPAYMELVLPVVDSIAPAVERILAARAAGEAGGDLAERVRAERVRALADEIRDEVRLSDAELGTSWANADYRAGMTSALRQMCDRAALLDPAPADGSSE